ncbi:ATP-binding protein [Streptomyces sp. SID2888]|uniref:ATP-binding protein n=1 Tax=Streptomyces TaxID=1883 RepID=UPI00136E1942|nr:ATP-binding protein [Streptomyces sp. SID2888]MYV47791.1 ATP-binding protein [Streptomyces sp. SID2888]
MTIGAELAEYLPVPPESMLDNLELRIARAPRAAGEHMPTYEGLWVGRLRRIAAAKLQHWQLTVLIDPAQLLISELVTNALRYGTGPEIDFRLILTTGVLVILVDDGSPDPPQVRQPGPDDESGRGMVLVSTIATDWGIRPNGSATWCLLAIPGRA